MSRFWLEVSCGYCLAKVGDPCIDPTGKVDYEGTHTQRRVLSTKRRRETMGTNTEGLKLALWYLDKIGSPKAAKHYLRIATEALNKAQEKIT